MGAGHAHLHLIKQAHELTEAGYRITLVAPRWFEYSGAASGIAAGGRDPAEGRIDVAALTEGRVDHRQARVVGVDLEARTVSTDDGTDVAWDVLSFNIGSVARVPEDVPVHESVIAVKPLSDLGELRERLPHPPRGRGHRVNVIGAGPTGVELAAHLAARSEVSYVRLLDQGPLLSGLPPAAVAAVTSLLVRRGVEIRTGMQLEEVAEGGITLAGGRDDAAGGLSHDLAVLATGLAPPPLATLPGLGGPDGIPIRATLQHRDHDDVYATGDCADFLPGSLPRIGVHGVRQGPVLLAGLLARTGGGERPTYQPQRQALAILDLGGGTALAVRGRWWWLGRLSLLLKRRIDRRWINGYRC